MKKYFNYIFIFMVCIFVCLGKTKALEEKRVSREDFEGADNPFVLCGRNNDTGKNVCKGSNSPTIEKVTRIEGNREIELEVSLNSSNIDNGGYDDSDITMIDRQTDLTKAKGWTTPSKKDLPNYYFVMIPNDKVNKEVVSIAAYYPKAAKYKNEYIDIKAIYTVYSYGNGNNELFEHSTLKEHHLENYKGIIIGLPFNLRDVGTGFFHSAFNKVKYEFYASDTKDSVTLIDSKFLIKSLNYMDEKNESAIIPKTMSGRITSLEYVNKYLHSDRCGNNEPENLEFSFPTQSISYAKNNIYNIDPLVIAKPRSNNCFFENGKDDNGLPIAIDFYVNAFAFWFKSNYVEYYLSSYTGGNNFDDLAFYNIMFTPSSGSEFTDSIDYDYSIDMACTNCNSELESNKAIYIQDTTDWEDITNSGSSSCSKAKDYFEIKKDSGIYCRSEYEVIYPNKDDIITVYTGRFFTLNAKDEEFEKIVGTDKFVHNFKPISVNKKMECKGNISGQEEALKKYFLDEGNDDDKKNTSGGVIKLTYTDKKKKTYDFKSVKLKSELVGDVTSENSGDMIILFGNYYFTLPDKFYRYVQKKDAFSIRDYNTIKNNNPANYEDLGISNIPILFNDHKTGDKVSTTFEYILPENSKIKDAIEGGNEAYFGCPENIQVSNLYQKAKDNNSNDLLKASACYKLYGSASLNDKCVKNNLNKIKNCLKDDDYTCNLPVSDGKTPPCDPTKEICDDDECNPNLDCCGNCVEEFAKVIYRVIDVDNPFTYENGKIRNTGINWCSETLNDGKIDCSSNNSRVQSKIADKKYVSEEKAMYIVTLTPDKMQQIKDYNKDHSYDYYNCDKDVSDFCRSELLNGTSSVRSLGITGNCSTNYKTCTD